MELPETPPQERRQPQRERVRRTPLWIRLLPLVTFAAMVVLGPLLFGAVDRWVQIGLVLLLFVGVLLKAPAPLSGPARLALAAIAVLLVAAQFLPIFGGARWRTELLALGVEFPWTQHPEPVRAIEALLAGLFGIVWLQWVRTLAADRERRVLMVWILAGAGVIVALVCFGIKGEPSGRIFGLRPTIGWVGWGPFPNRNHTGSFLAMAALVCAGVTLWAFGKHRRLFGIASALAFVVILGALLNGRSRGALVAFVAGMTVLLVLALARSRDRRTWLVLGAALVVTLAVVLTFGKDVLQRFASQEEGTVSNELRRRIWHDTIVLWRDAPLFGHGLGMFQQIFPVYTTHDFDGNAVRHPESSWLLWVSEIGAVPLVLVLAAALAFMVRGLARAFAHQRRGFFLTAGLFGGVAALVAHAVFDVPAHRWGTSGFALALLGVAIPARHAGGGSRVVAFVPLAIAAVWALPFLTAVPWSPTRLAQLEELEQGRPPGAPVAVPYEEWAKVVRHFPIDPDARQFTGLALLERSPHLEDEWKRHLAVARRLAGSAWGYSVAQARAMEARFSKESMEAWKDAVSRSGRRAPEVLRSAISETAMNPEFGSGWAAFIQTRPDLALTYVRALLEEWRVSPEAVRPYFDFWIERRAFAGNLAEHEIADFHVVLRHYGDVSLLERWMKAYPARLTSDYKEWVTLLKDSGQALRAWQVYAKAIADPPLGLPPADTKLDILESQHRALPLNFHVALTLAQHYEAAGRRLEAEAVILAMASAPEAPAWFLRKGAHILAGQGRHAEAVELAMRER